MGRSPLKEDQPSDTPVSWCTLHGPSVLLLAHVLNLIFTLPALLLLTHGPASVLTLPNATTTLPATKATTTILTPLPASNPNATNVTNVTTSTPTQSALPFLKLLPTLPTLSTWGQHPLLHWLWIPFLSGLLALFLIIANLYALATAWSQPKCLALAVNAIGLFCTFLFLGGASYVGYTIGNWGFMAAGALELLSLIDWIVLIVVEVRVGPCANIHRHRMEQRGIFRPVPALPALLTLPAHRPPKRRKPVPEPETTSAAPTQDEASRIGTAMEVDYPMGYPEEGKAKGAGQAEAKSEMTQGGVTVVPLPPLPVTTTNLGIDVEETHEPNSGPVSVKPTAKGKKLLPSRDRSRQIDLSIMSLGPSKATGHISVMDGTEKGGTSILPKDPPDNVAPSPVPKSSNSKSARSGDEGAPDASKDASATQESVPAPAVGPL